MNFLCVHPPTVDIPHIDLTVNFKKSEFKTLFKLWNTILFLECGNFCIYLSIFELLLRRILNFWTTDINWIVLVDEFYCFPMSWTAPKPIIAKVFYLILLMECIFILVYYFHKTVWYHSYFLHGVICWNKVRHNKIQGIK